MDPKRSRLPAYISPGLRHRLVRLDALKHMQAEKSLERDALLPSILNRAFKGVL